MATYTCCRLGELRDKYGDLRLIVAPCFSQEVSCIGFCIALCREEMWRLNLEIGLQVAGVIGAVLQGTSGLQLKQ